MRLLFKDYPAVYENYATVGRVSRDTDGANTLSIRIDPGYVTPQILVEILAHVSVADHTSALGAASSKEVLINAAGVLLDSDRLPLQRSTEQTRKVNQLAGDRGAMRILEKVVHDYQSPKRPIAPCEFDPVRLKLSHGRIQR